MSQPIENAPEQAATDTDALETSESSLSAAYGNALRDSGHDVRETRSHDYDVNQQIVMEEIANRRQANSEFEQRLRHTEELFDSRKTERQQLFSDNRKLADQLFDAKMARDSALQQQAQTQTASQAATASTNAAAAAMAASTHANSQALAQTAVNVKLSDGIYLP